MKREITCEDTIAVVDEISDGLHLSREEQSSLSKETSNTLCPDIDNSNSAPGKLYYDSGELKYEGFVKNEIPYGTGIKYHKNGKKQMESYFGDWFIVTGREYYENGNLKFEGEYNSGPSHYYGPDTF